MRSIDSHNVPIAHTKETKKKEYEVHSLEAHLTKVAKLAQSFALPSWAWLTYLAGLWHDIGKYSREFQRYIRTVTGYNTDAHIETEKSLASGKVDHSTAGGQHAVNEMMRVDPEMGRAYGKILAYVIMGHHTGLPNGDESPPSSLINRLRKTIPDYSRAPDRIKQVPEDLVRTLPRLDRFGLSFMIRMIFSCLVDGDFLDTERFMNPTKANQRVGYPSLEVLQARLAGHLEALAANDATPVIELRRAISNSCSQAAAWHPGFFSLTVPTGGGKTLSTLRFAIEHALHHGKKRIIYVIPYMSIIDQNANVFREILELKDEAPIVLEHHSNFVYGEEDHRSRLAAENWDAPLIVTTNVQFFESLFSARPGRCRKLHNIANSVVILDEWQKIPPPVLRPSLEALRTLVDQYQTSVVFCTATQLPLWEKQSWLPKPLEDVREMMVEPSPNDLFTAMKRVDLISTHLVLSWPELAKRLQGRKSVLCVVNLRRNAQKLFAKLKGKGNYHLSAAMCPAHRIKTIRAIQNALKEERNGGPPCRVISTSVVEAGVDLDFRTVYRSHAGLDSAVQAAGRCNREGLLEQGEVYLFNPIDKDDFEAILPQIYAFRDVMGRDLNDLDTIDAYFRGLFWRHGERRLDAHEIIDLLVSNADTIDIPFREVEKAYSLIDDPSVSILIPYDKEAESLIKGFSRTRNHRTYLRKLSPYSVGISAEKAKRWLREQKIELVHNNYLILVDTDLYDEDLGLLET